MHIFEYTFYVLQYVFPYNFKNMNSGDQMVSRPMEMNRMQRLVNLLTHFSPLHTSFICSAGVVQIIYRDAKPPDDSVLDYAKKQKTN